jgi:tetratricopeptide (TPR) repeat protein
VALQTVAGYVIVGEIARGGMGRVFMARDTSLDREVAIKLLRPDPTASDAVARFANEARITAKLAHPAIPPVHQFGVTPDGSPFLAMKLVRGQTLAYRLGERPTPATDLPRFLQVFEQICQAVGFAHRHGVIHRDLKPANVMVGEFGEVQVMDWGLAKELRDPKPELPPEQPAATAGAREATAGGTEDTVPHGPESSTADSTRPGAAMGTPAFMPPEQARGEWDRVGPWSDVFSLGGIFCQILTGSPPYTGKSTAEVLEKAGAGAVEEAFARLDSCGADAELVELAKRCLAPDRLVRPADGGAVADAVAAYRAGVEDRARKAEADRAAAEAEAREQRKRRKVQLALAAALGVILLGGGAFAWWQDRQAERRKFEQQQQAAAEHDRQMRNGSAIGDLVARCEFALKGGDTQDAGEAFAEAERRVPEGGGEELADRLARCRADLATIRELDQIDNLWWTPIDGKVHSQAAVAATEAAFRRLGIVPNQTPPEEAARRIRESLVSDRLVAVLDRWAVSARVPELVPILRAVDPDEYRNAVRAALLGEDEAKVAELTRRPEVFAQPPRFAVLFGAVGLVPTARKWEILQATLAHAPRDFHALMTIASTYPINRREGTGERVGWFHAALALRPANPTAWLCLGTALGDAGQTARAIEALAEAVRLAPASAPAHCNYGVVLWKAGRRDQALTHLRRAVELEPNSAYTYHNLGSALLALGRKDEALAACREAVRLDPNLPLAQITLGRVLAHLAKSEEAVGCFETAIRLDPTLPVAHREYGVVLAMNKDFDKALAEFREAIRLDRFDAQAHIGAGAALGTKGQTDEALVHFREAARLDPKSALARRNIGEALVRKFDRLGAIAAFREAIAIDPNDAPSHSSLGVVLLTTGKHDEAAKHLREAARLDRTLALGAYTNLGRALAAKEDFRGAAEAFAKAAELTPNDPEVRGYVALALVKAGDLPAAEAAYRELVRVAPKSPAAHNDLGYARELLGELEGAAAEYRVALALNPDFAPAKANLNRVRARLDHLAPPPRPAKR